MNYSRVTVSCGIMCHVTVMWLYHVCHVTVMWLYHVSCGIMCHVTVMWQPYECDHVTVHVTLCTWPYCGFIMWLYPMTWGLPNLFFLLFLSLVTQPEAETQWIQWLLQSLEENNVSSRWTRVAHTIIFFSTWLRNVKPCAQWYCNTCGILIILNFMAIHAQIV